MKSEIFNKFHHFINIIKNQLGLTIKSFQSEN